jgi:K+-sensing histidine kinase KdpD
VVAAIVSTVAAQAHRRAAEALDHADQAVALQGLARGLMIAPDSQTILRLVAEASARVFKAPAVALAATPQGWASASEPPNQPLTASDTDAAQWALASKLASRADAYPMDASRYDFWPVITPRGVQAAIGLALRDRDAERPAVPERLVEIVSGYLAVALERERFAGEAIEARVNREGERLKADLLAAVSHDLRTPLSTIVFSLQSLRRFSGEHDAQAKAELLALTETEAVKLAGMVEGLLDMSRIDGGVVAARPGAEPLAELVDGALRRMQGALANHTLIAQPPPIGLTVSADPVLAESALANVLENAAKYSPAGSTITVRCEVRDGQAVVEVLDEGEGFGGPTEPLFAKFVRGVEGDGRPAGSGLGLSIARGFLEAQGGRIEAGDRVGGGAWVRLFLPLAEPTVATP